MISDLLDTPLRISWQLSPEGSLTDAQTLIVAGRLVESGVFYVTLEGRPLAHPKISEILQTFAATGPQVILICSGTADELANLRYDLPIRQLYLDAAPGLAMDDFQFISTSVKTIRDLGFEPGVLLIPRHDNIAKLRGLFEFCRTHRIVKIKLPNVGIDGSVKNLFAAGLVTPDDLQCLARALAPDATSGLELEVHDLFLWELLCSDRQGSRSEYGGCQAANSLGHVDDGGNIYPCSSWPEPLGSLLDHSVETLWARPERLAIREEIDRMPTGCRGCLDFLTCFGGCRGLARTLNRHQGGRDPMCREPRK